MINIFRKMKQKSKDRIFSEYPCADFLHNALHFLARNNQYKYLLETRLSGSLTKVYSAIALEENVA